MEKVVLSEIRDIAQYERVREPERARIIERKRPRRVGLGENLTLLFENHETVLFQVQEMMRTERIADEAKIQDELDIYNALIPGPGELSATLFIEIPGISRMSTGQMRAAVNRFRGIDEGRLRLEIGGHVMPARFESGESSEEKMAAVHFVRFAVPEAAQALLADAAAAVRLRCTHPHHPATADLAPETRAELMADLA
jgi:Protein of unknown function (DUF3501)